MVQSFTNHTTGTEQPLKTPNFPPSPDNENGFLYSFRNDLRRDPHGSPGKPPVAPTPLPTPFLGWGTPLPIPLHSQEPAFDSALSGVECACAVDGAGSRAKAYVHQFTSTVLFLRPADDLGGRCSR
ncbi:hypothetical protein AVEN_107458-1 [Araneus ventricosus]|uniref:Uncharacterized protein n=1 Tax=Araneus ventricosus TaxID=182803 RepID=A0A4Y2GA70_ARAVE|nr:hypothetical protein AVEN_107458-1 [Araneus ventricosus]